MVWVGVLGVGGGGAAGSVMSLVNARGMYSTTLQEVDCRTGQGCNNPAVSYNRRRPRQGVRYGPPRERERYSENGVIVGRIVGLGILLLTLGVLAASALAFISDRRGSPISTSRATTSTLPASPGRPLPVFSAASVGPPTVAASTLGATPPTIAAPTALASLPAGSLAPLVNVGPGFVTFGTRADRLLRIVNPAGSFPIGERLIWSAYLTQPANSIDLRVQVFKLDGTPPTGERLILDEPVTPLEQDAQVFQRRIRPSEVLDGAGLYVVRYVRGTEILSEGQVEITA